MKTSTNPLDNVRVAAPCSVDWERMSGNERIRFCAQCNLNVYNLSGMTRTEAERLIASSEGRLCIRFYRRTDGTILTRNCPVGLRGLKQRLTRVASAVASMLLSFLAGIFAFTGLRETPARGGYTQGTIARQPPKPVDELGDVKGQSVAPTQETVGRIALYSPEKRDTPAVKAHRRRLRSD
jgi:hypothetical protein